MFAFAALAALTVMLTTASAPAAAAASGVPATVTFTGLNPQWASPGTTVKVTGSVKNTAPASQRLVVLLLDSSTPVSSISELQQSASSGYSLAGNVLPNATWSSGLLKPGASASWTIQVPVGGMGFSTFGVYPLAAQLQNGQGTNLNIAQTYLPYVPARSGPYGSSVPAAQKISWVWPLIDQPLLEEPWQSVCTGAQAPQAAALAQSLASGGRLGQLVDAAGTAAGTAAVQAQAARADTSGAAQRLATVTEPIQSLAQTDAVTWAVDPALLDNVSALAQCGATEPQWARTASTWLTRLKETTASQPMFVTAYGDPNLLALIGAGKGPDVKQAFKFGRSRGSQILGRNLAPAPAGGGPASTAGLAWSTGAPTSSIAAELAGQDTVGTLVAGSSAFPLAPTSTVRALNGIGGYLNVLLTNDSLTSLLGSAGPGSAFTTAQEFLAETALLAQQHSSAPIIAAPPQRWQPPAGLASTLLSDTAAAPWLSPATLTSLTTAAHVPTVQLPTTGPGLSSFEQDQLSALDAAVTRHLALRAGQDQSLVQAVSTIESSAYSGRFKATALGMVEMLAGRMAAQEQRVHIVAENRITLGGTHGNVPVSIDNRLPFAVRVTLQLSYSQADGVRVSPSPAGAITVPAHTAETVRLAITAAQPGSTTITMTLLNEGSPPQPLASPAVRTTVQTTQVGLLGVIIFGAALGVFLLASAARALRRGRPRQHPDEAQRPAPREDDLPGQSTEEARADTVVTGHGDLGPARSPRPR